jgi:hypothetical protein
MATCIYQAMAAKFAAESASDVGRDTEVVVRYRSVPPCMELPPDLINFVRETYNRIKRIPEDAVTAIDAEMKRFDLVEQDMSGMPPHFSRVYDHMLTREQALLVIAAHAEREQKKLASPKPKKSTSRESKNLQ